MQKTAYDMRISDWSSDVCSSDLALEVAQGFAVVDALAVGAHDHVARLQASLLGGRTGIYARDRGAARAVQAQRPGDALVHVLGFDAQRAAADHAAVGQLLHPAGGQVRGEGRKSVG